ncbi:MAG: hypothetical protein AB8H79_01535, partial [Myxococcota bacterium]
GDIIITEGDPGNSLFILTTGVVKAFLKSPGTEGQRLVRTMTEHCLDQDRASDAERALANLSIAPRDLARRVERARRRSAVGLSGRSEQTMMRAALIGTTLVATAAAIWLVGPPGIAIAVAGLGGLAAHLGTRLAL